MIKYTLVCDQDHDFDGWFRSSDDYDQQLASGFLTCPMCNSEHVSKALMAPSVTNTKKSSTAMVPVEAPATSPDDNQKVQVFNPDPQAVAVREAIKKVRDYVQQHAEYVGSNFASEARKIHNEESESRGIYGESTVQEVVELRKDGIEIQPLPLLPEEQN